MKTQRLLALLTAALVGPGLVSCGGPPPGDAEVKIRIQGLSSADNAIVLVLPAPDGGIKYDFNIIGAAAATQADFTLDVFLGATVVHSVNFSLPLGVTGATAGETGSGSTSATIYPDTTNSVTIEFHWTAPADDKGSTDIDLSFMHPPQIHDWSVAPGPGVVAGTTISVQADVEFFGSGGTVTAQFWNGGTSSYIGTAGSLSYSDPVWSGTVTTVLGATELHLIASDSEGDATSTMAFVVDIP